VLFCMVKLMVDRVLLERILSDFRNLIVHYYERIDDAIVYGVFKKNLSDFDLFIDRILEYLQRTFTEVQ